MGRSNPHLLPGLLVSLAVVCAFPAGPPVLARAPEPGQPAARESVKELVRIEAKGSIPFYAIAPDGKTLAYCETVSPGSELVLIDLETGKELRRRRSNYTSGGAFSADGKCLAVDAWEVPRTATIWDVARWEPKVQLQYPDGLSGACPLAFSPDGKVVAGRVRGKDFRSDIILWDVATGACRVLDPGQTKVVIPDGLGNLLKVRPGETPTLLQEFGETVVGREPVAASFAEHGGQELLFVEYHVKDQFGVGAEFTTLWDTAHGKPLRTAAYLARPASNSLQYRGLVGRGAPVPGSTMDLLRFRTAPSGRILLLPRYNPPPVLPLPHDKDGTIALLVSPPAFGNVPTYANFTFTELCRLEDYKGTNNVTCRLTPDGRRLVAVGNDLGTGKAERPCDVIRVWDLTALHAIAVKKKYQLSEAEREHTWRGLFEEGYGPQTSLFVPYHYVQSLPAAFSLVAHPDEAVPWLRKKMGTPPDWTKVTQRIADLGSLEFETREAASHDLERLGDAVRPLLERRLAKETDAEARRRIKDLLARPSETAAAYEVRQLRIIDILEHVNTAAARELLKQMADGKYDPAFAEEATKALQRATGKP